MLIYAADDESGIRRLIEVFLKSEGYDAVTFETGDALLEAFMQAPCDLAILDIMMPGSDGLTIAQALRRVSKVPIIMLTAKGEEEDIIRGLTLGSDDYLIKPFRPALLLVHVKALLRRVSLEQEAQRQADQAGDLACGDLLYESGARQTLCGGQSLKLTLTEQNLLLYLMRRSGRAVSREELLRDIWSYDTEVETRVTDETVRRVRAKLLKAGSAMQIETIWGFGYRMDAGGNP